MDCETNFYHDLLRNSRFYAGFGSPAARLYVLPSQFGTDDTLQLLASWQGGCPHVNFFCLETSVSWVMWEVNIAQIRKKIF